MTTYTKEVYQGVPFSYRLRKAHYYDIIGKDKISADTSLSKSFVAYAGLNLSFNQYGESVPNVSITGGTLPDYSVTPDVDGCMGAVGNTFLVLDSNNQPQEKTGLLATTDDGSAQTWNLFYNNGFVLDTVSTKSGYSWCGSVSVPAHTVYPSYKKGDFSITGTLYWSGYKLYNFSTSDYISTNYTFSMTPSEFSQGFTIQLHIVTPSTFVNDWPRLMSFGSTYLNAPYFTVRPNGVGLDVGFTYNGSRVFQILADYNLSPNTEYWIRLTKPNTQFFTHDTDLEISTDGTTWTNIGSSSTSITETITGDTVVTLGYAPDAAAQYFTGKIDLRDTFIEINGTKVWSALI